MQFINKLLSLSVAALVLFQLTVIRAILRMMLRVVEYQHRLVREDVAVRGKDLKVHAVTQVKAVRSKVSALCVRAKEKVVTTYQAIVAWSYRQVSYLNPFVWKQGRAYA